MALLAHRLFRRRHRFDEGGTGEQALAVFQQRRGLLRQDDAVMVQAPQQRSDGHVEHGKFLAQHEFLLGEQGRQLRQVVADRHPRLIGGFLGAVLDGLDMAEQFLFKTVEEQAAIGVPTHLRDSSYARLEKMTGGQNINPYKYPHDYPNHYVKQQYLPSNLLGLEFYQPSDSGEEKMVRELLERLKKL